MIQETSSNRREAAHPTTVCSLNADPSHCITCADELLAVKVLAVDAATTTARVQVQDHEEEIDISLLDGVTPGEVVLVHAGVAITCLGKESSYAEHQRSSQS